MRVRLAWLQPRDDRADSRSTAITTRHRHKGLASVRARRDHDVLRLPLLILIAARSHPDCRAIAPLLAVGHAGSAPCGLALRRWRCCARCDHGHACDCAAVTGQSRRSLPDAPSSRPSVNSSNRFPINSPVIALSPVTFPPGRASPATTPVSRGPRLRSLRLGSSQWECGAVVIHLRESTLCANCSHWADHAAVRCNRPACTRTGLRSAGVRRPNHGSTTTSACAVSRRHNWPLARWHDLDFRSQAASRT